MNFNDISTCKEILKQDKHTRLEGICIEHFFIRNYLTNINIKKISTGWWFFKKEYDDKFYQIIKFLHNLELSATDIQLIKYFIGNNVPVYLVFYDSKFDFFTCTAKKLSSFTPNSIKKNSQQYKYSTLKPISKMVKNIERQNQSIRYLEKEGLVKKAAIERFFANRIVGFKGLWDIDALYIDENNNINGFEVKQKFPAKDGRFGINQGTTNFLLFLIKLGIEIEHVILKKPEDNKEIPALNFIELEKYKGKNEWLSTTFAKNCIDDFTVKESPKETSIHGRYRLKYLSLDMSKFTSKGFI